MVAVKVCGITRLEDAVDCLSLGVDAIGFIFYPHSHRYIPPERAKIIISKLEKVGFSSPPSGGIFSCSRRPAICGVFVNEEIKKVKSIIEHCRLDFVQFHGHEPPSYVAEFPPDMVIKNFPLRTRRDLNVLENYRIHAALVDAYHPHLFGGTGKKAAWDLAREVKRYCPLILSGGLNIENILDALREVAPDAVDVNSGVESSPGVKDREKIRKIVSLIYEKKGKT